MLLVLLLLFSTAPPEGPPAGRLEGSAILGRNRPVVGATVVAGAGPARVHVTTSDGRGRFEFLGLADGSYRVEVAREGLEPAVKEGVEVRFPFRAVIEVTLLPAAGGPVAAPAPARELPAGEPGATVAVVRGRVVEGPAGSGVPDVMLRLTHAGGQTDPRAVRSAVDGSFELAVSAAGAWILETRAVGYLPVRARLPLTADGWIEVRLVRQPPGYEPSALELMPPEELPVPEGLAPPEIDVPSLP